MLQFIEAKPSVSRSDASLLAAHPDVAGLFADRREVQTALDDFIDALARLPRTTREFLGWMVDEAEQTRGLGSGGLEVNADYVEAKCRAVPNFLGEIRLLTARGFIDFDQEERHVSGRFRISFPGAEGTNFEEAFIYFRETTGLTAATLFSTMNFSPFGPPPVPVKAVAPGTARRPRASRMPRPQRAGPARR
jgi:hypothetical protein